MAECDLTPDEDLRQKIKAWILHKGTEKTDTSGGESVNISKSNAVTTPKNVTSLSSSSPVNSNTAAKNTVDDDLYDF